jgi:hypothetical protein
MYQRKLIVLVMRSNLVRGMCSVGIVSVRLLRTVQHTGRSTDSSIVNWNPGGSTTGFSDLHYGIG